MATQKNSKSTRATASKGKSAKAAPSRKPANKAAKASAKPKTSGKALPKAKPKKASAAKKPLAARPKTTSKPVAKKKAPATGKSKVTLAKSAKPARPKATSKPVVKSKPGKPVLTAKPQTSAVITKSKSIGKQTSSPTKALQSKAPVKPVIKPAAVFKSQPKSVPAKPIHSTPVMKSTGSKSSDLAKPSISSRPMVEKPSFQAKAKDFQRKSLKQSTIHPVKPFETMTDKREHKPVAAAYNEEPHKTRYSDKELEEFDQLIDQKLIVAREQLEFYLKQLEDMAENPDNKIKGLDDGLSTLESERVSSMAARQQKLIQHLENAKIRIKNKVYGICRETGRLISKERLRAVPHATLSIEAKQAQN